MRIRILLLIAFLAVGGGGRADDAPGKRVVGYFIEWGVYGRQYFVKNIEESGAAARLTHLIYAFADIGEDLRCRLGEVYPDIDMFYAAGSSVDGVADSWDAGALRGSFNQLRKLKLLHPDLKVMIAIGGWTWSGRFSDAALTPESREAFVASAVDLFIRGNFAPGISVPGVFDGIDIDWEYPAAPGMTNNYRPEDTVNYTLLLAEFRKQLDEQGALDGREYLLSIGAPMGPDKLSKIEIEAVSEIVDFINLMAYDFHGTWETATHFHAPLFEPAGDPSAGQGLCADAGVAAYLAAGAAAEKLNLGVPFYGRGWKGVPPGPGGDGLFQPGTGAAPATWEAGHEDYKVLKTLEPACGKHREATALAPWIYCPAEQVFWSYDDPEAVTAKMDYVVANGLGGGMFWELSGDDSSGSLVAAMADALSGTPPPAPLPIAVLALAGRARPGGGADKCGITCEVVFDGGLADLEGATFDLEVCGQDLTFTLDRRGRAVSEFGKLTARISRKTPGSLQLKAKLKGLTLSPGLAAAGLDLGTTARKVPATVSASVRLDGRLHGPEEVRVLGSTRAGRGGRFKGPAPQGQPAGR